MNRRQWLGRVRNNDKRYSWCTRDLRGRVDVVVLGLNDDSEEGLWTIESLVQDQDDSRDVVITSKVTFNRPVSVNTALHSISTGSM
jgi:hypothetical protein